MTIRACPVDDRTRSIWHNTIPLTDDSVLRFLVAASVALVEWQAQQQHNRVSQARYQAEEAARQAERERAEADQAQAQAMLDDAPSGDRALDLAGK